MDSLNRAIAGETDKNKGLMRDIGQCERDKGRIEMEKGEFKQIIERIEAKRGTERHEQELHLKQMRVKHQEDLNRVRTDYDMSLA